MFAVDLMCCGFMFLFLEWFRLSYRLQDFGALLFLGFGVFAVLDCIKWMFGCFWVAGGCFVGF